MSAHSSFSRSDFPAKEQMIGLQLTPVRSPGIRPDEFLTNRPESGNHEPLELVQVSAHLKVLKKTSIDRPPVLPRLTVEDT